MIRRWCHGFPCQNLKGSSCLVVKKHCKRQELRMVLLFPAQRNFWLLASDTQNRLLIRRMTDWVLQSRFHNWLVGRMTWGSCWFSFLAAKMELCNKEVNRRHLNPPNHCQASVIRFGAVRAFWVLSWWMGHWRISTKFYNRSMLFLMGYKWEERIRMPSRPLSSFTIKKKNRVSNWRCNAVLQTRNTLRLMIQESTAAASLRTLPLVASKFWHDLTVWKWLQSPTLQCLHWTCCQKTVEDPHLRYPRRLIDRQCLRSSEFSELLNPLEMLGASKVLSILDLVNIRVHY